MTFGQVAQRDRDGLLVSAGDDGLAGAEVGNERAQRDGRVPGPSIAANAAL